ncbi:SUMF1/EgtB/PvdO family nonheme iron enzyme [Oligosphaera ethanolica]|uniref:Formylglycine-generating enzyme required for sulfatase activity n=1 Tax=Oligosphaera ethanolica TaxID=760260 RepID=A0AAE3VKB6_9BACT|nr:SUMF1/EgtB/PvdO family nonheme iron enzyme [Oligosphaera ethanolica]MDQ0291906.1 formylglycine-generating enzyme required for sulfatase activity [Oligosphaera ethanolica]
MNKKLAVLLMILASLFCCSCRKSTISVDLGGGVDGIWARSLDLGGGVMLDLVLIPPGKFLMGSEYSEDDEQPVHEVTISQPFYLGKYEVTQAQWEAVMGWKLSESKGPTLPVDEVAWGDCQLFIEKLNGRGLGTFRLPTEAEWEYACRAGTTGDYAREFDEMAWHADNSDSGPNPVGTKKPNPWWLYDMHGNVLEWCQDWYAPYSENQETDPKGAAVGSLRVARGGDWSDSYAASRSASRSGREPWSRRYLGFRLVRMCIVEGDTEEAKQMKRIAKEAWQEARQKKRLAEEAEQAERLAEEAEQAKRLAEEAEKKRQLIAKWMPFRAQAAEHNAVVAGEEVVNTIGMRFRLIPAGTFRMGSEKGYDYEMPVHEVEITQPFYLGVTEVTQAQWEAVMGSNPRYSKGAALPVACVKWADAVAFCERLSAKEAWVKYRLPTEAEWEYACRAGSQQEYSWHWSGEFEDEIGIDDYAWYGGNASDATHEVGTLKPNRWGLYDMHGNVSEWCQDWAGPCSQDRQIDPKGAVSGDQRVFRGGSYLCPSGDCRSVARLRMEPHYWGVNLGYRIVAMGLVQGDTEEARQKMRLAEEAWQKMLLAEEAKRQEERLADEALQQKRRAEEALEQKRKAEQALEQERRAVEALQLERRTEEALQLERIAKWEAYRAQAAEHNAVVAGEEVVNTIGMRFRLIPAGTFRMGSEKGDDNEGPVDEEAMSHFFSERPEHEVEITQPFYLGVTEVTQAQWEAVRGTNPSFYRGAALPVDCVSWADAVAFCERLSATETGVTYRLPTEAEWEYACRAGSQQEFSWHWSDELEGEIGIEDYAWYGGNASDATHEVGKLKPNRWGLYDMHGNVWEWCQDWAGPYSQDKQTDPKGAAGGPFRLLRGGGNNYLRGGGNNYLSWCYRSAARLGRRPLLGDISIGFRIVREVP